jgi:hypothetical protein
MSITIDKILAASPNTERGRPTQLSTDPKGQRIAYAVSDLLYQCWFQSFFAEKEHLTDGAWLLG